MYTVFSDFAEVGYLVIYSKLAVIGDWSNGLAEGLLDLVKLRINYFSFAY